MLWNILSGDGQDKNPISWATCPLEMVGYEDNLGEALLKSVAINFKEVISWVGD